MNLKELAEQAGLAYKTPNGKYWIDAGYPDIHLERFAELIAAAEREECAKLCEQLLEESVSAYKQSEFEKQQRLLCLKMIKIPLNNIAAAIRARGTE